MKFFGKIFHDPDFTWVEEHEFPFNKNQTYNETYSGSLGMNKIFCDFKLIFDSNLCNIGLKFFLESCFSNDTTKKPNKEYFCKCS